MNGNYSLEEIKIIEDCEAIRKRPRMYVSSTDGGGIRDLLYELIYNSLEEVLADRAGAIAIELNPDGSFSVTDNGRGISAEVDPKTGKSILERAMTKLSFRGSSSGDRYKVTGGWNGFGLVAVNALSEWIEVTVWRDGKTYRQKYNRGVASTELEIKLSSEERTGTCFVFKPDPEIFGTENQIEETAIALRLQQLAYLNAGVNITLSDRRVEPARVYRYRYVNGIRDYMARSDREPLHEVIYAAGKRDGIEFEVALQWRVESDTDYLLKFFPCAALLGQRLEEWNREQLDGLYLISFVNRVQTVRGGTHVAGVKSAVTRSMSAIARRNLSWFEVRKGLTGIVSVTILEPEYKDTDPGRWELVNPEVENVLSEVVGEAIASFLQSHRDVAETFLDRFARVSHTGL